MNNILLDPLPECWTDSSGKSYQLDTDFRIGIQICLIQEDAELTNREKSVVICSLLFPGEMPADPQQLEKCISFFIHGWSHDKPGKKEEKRLMDFDVDQWRIYSAFYSQYRIDLNTADLHWWQFMGLLSTLGDCAYTRVIDIRQRKFKPKMDKEERKALREAKEVYGLETVLTPEEQAFSGEMDELLGVSAKEKQRIETFEGFA